MALGTNEPNYQINVELEDLGLDTDVLYKALLGEQCFCITDICPPEVDLSDELWTIPVDKDSAIFKSPQMLDINMLTNADSSGVFDRITDKIKDVLLIEHEKGRITGSDYARTLANLIEGALTNATQFLVQKDVSFWQAQRGYYDAWGARAQVELGKHQIILAQMQQINSQVEYVNGKMQLMVNKENYMNALANRDITIPKQTELNDAQIGLYNQQVVSYKRDAEVKAAKVFTDAWIAMKTINENIHEPANFSQDKVNDVLIKLRQENGFD